MKLFSEGEINFLAPVGEISKKLSVFYNPLMSFDRDLTVAIARKIGGKSYCDGMAASGIRGMRAAKEAGYNEVYVNDISPDAVKLAEKNLRANGIEASLSNKDVNLFLREHKCDKIDVIDLDPFGPFIGALDSAVRALNRKGGLLCLTATDTAALCGVSVKTCMRRYESRPLRSSYAKEIGLRILIGACARTVARYDSALEPVFSYSRRHYFRLFLRASRGISKANAMLDKLAYIQHCFKCNWRGYVKTGRFLQECPNCGGRLDWAGPLWTGAFANPSFCKGIRTENSSVADLVAVVAGEQEFPAPFYDIHHLASLNGIPAPKKSALLESGYAPTHFCKWGVRGDEMPRL